MGLRGLVLAAAVRLGIGLVLAPAGGPASAQQSEADVFVAQAILAYDAKRYDEAHRILRDALQLDPKRAPASNSGVDRTCVTNSRTVRSGSSNPSDGFGLNQSPLANVTR